MPGFEGPTALADGDAGAGDAAAAKRSQGSEYNPMALPDQTGWNKGLVVRKVTADVFEMQPGKFFELQHNLDSGDEFHLSDPMYLGGKHDYDAAVKKILEAAQKLEAEPAAVATATGSGQARRPALSISTRKTQGPGPAGLYAALPGDRKVVVKVNVSLLGYTAEQRADLAAIAGLRYDAARATLKIVAESHGSAQENRAVALGQLNALHAAVTGASAPLVSESYVSGAAFADDDSETYGVEEFRSPAEADAQLEGLSK
eukprot:a15690_14.p1 GENE.a15690_14~~a15690_14.p1  ORF type:complete len:297 (+),score=84.70 a15690_14:116-892(+)